MYSGVFVCYKGLLMTGTLHTNIRGNKKKADLEHSLGNQRTGRATAKAWIAVIYGTYQHGYNRSLTNQAARLKRHTVSHILIYYDIAWRWGLHMIGMSMMSHI